jgi:hypothetical protein
MAASRDRE